ncbi:hypothetical protein GCM10009760_12430 [Kitasatospora kazusensis]|uniref:Uncharacterized protein n=1 Tax=Kitasatospora kazusensis TaxID=407974 RepID=A0ABN2Z0D0_9ACTN
MSPDEQFGQAMPEAMDHAARQFAPHSPDLVQRATLRGRRLRRTRRAQLGAVTVIALGGTVLGLNQLTPATSPTSGRPSAPPSPTYRPPVYSPPTVPRSGSLYEQFAALLPERGHSTEVESSGSFTDGRLSGIVRSRLVFYDGHGGTTVTLNVKDPDPLAPASPLDCPPVGEECGTLPDGTQVVAGRFTPGNGLVKAGVQVLRPDGRLVDILEYNTDDLIVGGGNLPLAEPALSLDELTAVALSPHWEK